MTNIQSIIKETRTAMEKSLDNTKREFATIHAGKASPSMLDTVRVEVYGTTMTMNQVAQVAAPESRMLLVTPFDKSQAKAIEKAIREANLGLDPAQQGGVIRVPLPSLNTERRKELVKVVHKFAEEGKIGIRHARTHGRERDRDRNDGDRDSLPELGDQTSMISASFALIMSSIL